jgi:ParB/RepB/Spo0J family partition protein
MKKLYENSNFFYTSPSSVRTKEDRVRQEFDPVKMEELKFSLMKRGQINPVVIDEEGFLVAGERRLKACQDLNWEVLTVSVKDLDPTELLELELHENFSRTPLNPIEECLGFFRLHNQRRENMKGAREWGVRDTAELTGVGKSLVADCVAMGEAIHSAPHLFLECKTKSEIKKKIKDIERQAKWLDLQDDVKRLISVAEMSVDAQTEFEKDFADREARAIKEGRLPPPETPRAVMTEEQLAERDRLVVEGRMQEWDRCLMTGDCYEEFPKMREKSVGVLLLDPPWGIGIDEKVESGALNGEAYKDDESDFLDRFPTLCEVAYEKAAADSHVYCFFGIKHFEFVYSNLEKVGFISNRRPIILIKEGVKSTRIGNYWPGATYECIAFCRKGKRELVQMAPPDHFLVKWPHYTEKLQHPSAKPPEVYVHLLRMSAYPGDIVVDPFFGTGPAFVACELLPELHLRWWGWDLEPENKNKAMLNLTRHIIRRIPDESQGG